MKKSFSAAEKGRENTTTNNEVTSAKNVIRLALVACQTFDKPGEHLSSTSLATKNLSPDPNHP